MKRITTWCKWFAWLFRKIPTTKQAIEMRLKHETNIYGDGINMTGCRSFWNDEYGRRFGCEQLLDGGKDVVMDEIKRKHPELFKN